MPEAKPEKQAQQPEKYISAYAQAQAELWGELDRPWDPPLPNKPEFVEKVRAELADAKRRAYECLKKSTQ